MNAPNDGEDGEYFRGDSKAAKHLGMDRTTFARLVRIDGPRPSIVGGYRYWSRTALAEWMASKRAKTAYVVRPELSKRNREKAAAARAATQLSTLRHSEIRLQHTMGAAANGAPRP